ncbi:helix-turn-helix transcriptional regulator [Halosolutus halophilus]|uniref:helix-turn-helix transcriptional regulator n=1 Tax=Halosolutus halophilus TaxID=1552990 RepID=UPI0022352B6F|nr:helix-turn-helix domain-containing protein [Halosolutus halophilus]
MLDESRAIPEDALADIAYLARSSNRVEILATLATEPHASRDVAAATAASRSTLERILTELEERGWAERTTDGTYVATPAGEFAISKFVPLVGAMQAIRSLGDAVGWLPADELSIGLHHFRDATVSRPESNSPLAPDTQLVGMIREADSFHCLVRIAPSVAFENAVRDAVVEGNLTTEHVLTDGEHASLSERRDRLEHWREYLEAGANVYRYDDRIPCNLFVLDDAVFLANRQPETCAFIVTENERVRSWARHVIETYRREADRLDATAFSEESSTLANSNR